MKYLLALLKNILILWASEQADLLATNNSISLPELNISDRDQIRYHHISDISNSWEYRVTAKVGVTKQSSFYICSKKHLLS